MASEDTFSGLFDLGVEENCSMPDGLQPTEPATFRALSVFTTTQRDQAIHRLNLIKYLLKAGVRSFTEKTITPLLPELVREFGNDIPSWRTLARWWSLFKSSDFDIVALVPQITKGNSNFKTDPLLEPLIAEAIGRIMSAERPNLAEGHRFLETLVSRHNKGSNTQLQCISSEALRLRVGKITPFEELKARKGLTAANNEFRAIGQKIKTTRILERVEVDHTRLDLFVIDDIYFIPMGRPWLTLLIDSFSLSVVGFYLGFEPPSFVSVGHALKNAILPKSYVKENYPQVNNEWICSGLIELLVTDNGREFDDKDFKLACAELGMHVGKNPTKKPYLKASVERFFGTVNSRLLASPPGKTFPNIFERDDYDPEKNAVISLSKINLLIHKWIIDDYQQDPNARWTNMPNLSWSVAAQSFPPATYNGSIDELDFKLGRRFEPKLRKEGITKDKLRYHSDRLASYRGRYGDHRVTAKQDPNNLGRIVVLDNDKKEYFFVPAVDFDYANGLTLWQHNLHRKYTKEFIKANYNHQDVVRARSEIIDIVEGCMAEMATGKRKKISVTNRVRAGRYLEADRRRELPSPNTSETVEGNEKKEIPFSEESWDEDVDISEWTSSQVRK